MIELAGQPVRHWPRPANLHDQDEIWVLVHTGEIFVDYKSYLRRFDFYNQKKFTYKIPFTNSNSSYTTYFDALEKQSSATLLQRSSFPVPLRGPVLRKVQQLHAFKLDDIVNKVYDLFCEDFFPGETVILSLGSGENYKAVIREKTTIPKKRSMSESPSQASSHYFVRVIFDSGEVRESFVESHSLSRERCSFTKYSLKAFLRNTLTQEPFYCSRWVVKPEIAKIFNIPYTPISALKAGFDPPNRSSSPPSLVMSATANGDNKAPSIKSRGRKPVKTPFSCQISQKSELNHTELPVSSNLPNHYHDALIHSNNASPIELTKPDAHDNPTLSKTVPPRYPIEDLELASKSCKRPNLKFLTTLSSPESQKRALLNVLKPESVGYLLEVWNTLNVYREVFIIDSFTLDDLLDALTLNEAVLSCELLAEAHCAFLTRIVDQEGQILVDIPEFKTNDEDYDENNIDEDNNSESDTSTSPNVSEEPPRCRTRSSYAEQLAESAQKSRKQYQLSPEDEDGQSDVSSELSLEHKADEMEKLYGWINRLKAREFRDSNWIVITVGLLYQLSRGNHDKYEPILKHLAPLDLEPSLDTARKQYISLDINLRIQILQILCLLAVQTRVIRDHIEACCELATEIRKKKTSIHREKKAMIKESRDVDDQRRLLQHEMEVGRSVTDAEAISNEDGISCEKGEMQVKMEKKFDGEEGTLEDSGRVANGSGQKKLRKNSNGKEQKRAQESPPKKGGVGEGKKNAKHAYSFRKHLAKLNELQTSIKECDERLMELDGRMRENDVLRTKPLGYDRFWNKYYWFERNGMSFVPGENESSWRSGYRNGRLWVQGPEETELFERDDETKGKNGGYGVNKDKHKSDIWARRAIEENETMLKGPLEWGFYDDPRDVERLMNEWLDERGYREKELLKELKLWREPIIECMTKMREQRKKVEFEEKSEGYEGNVNGIGSMEGKGKGQTFLRCSSRLKSAAILNANIARQNEHFSRWPCLLWKNQMARRLIGHSHSRSEGGKRNISNIHTNQLVMSNGQSNQVVNATSGIKVTGNKVRVKGGGEVSVSSYARTRTSTSASTSSSASISTSGSMSTVGNVNNEVTFNKKGRNGGNKGGAGTSVNPITTNTKGRRRNEGGEGEKLKVGLDQGKVEIKRQSLRSGNSYSAVCGDGDGSSGEELGKRRILRKKG